MWAGMLEAILAMFFLGNRIVNDCWIAMKSNCSNHLNGATGEAVLISFFSFQMEIFAIKIAQSSVHLLCLFGIDFDKHEF